MKLIDPVMLGIPCAPDAIEWFKMARRFAERMETPQQPYLFLSQSQAVFCGMDVGAGDDRSHFIIIDDPMRIEASRVFMTSSYGKSDLINLMKPEFDYAKMLNSSQPRSILPSEMEFLRSH